MTKRLQVLLDEDEYDAIRATAHAKQMTVAEWVRQVMRRANLTSPRAIEGKMSVIMEGRRRNLPTADINVMIKEFEEEWNAPGGGASTGPPDAPAPSPRHEAGRLAPRTHTGAGCVAKRLQVLLDEHEYEAIKATAQAKQMTIAEWVRLNLGRAKLNSPKVIEAKLRAIEWASQLNHPTADIDVMLEEIAAGRNARGLR